MIKHIFATSTGTLVSRIFGYVRDFTIASSLGAGSTSDSFLVAFRFPNLFRAFFAEGINCVVIPMYSDSLRKGKTQAIEFTNRLFSLMIMVLSGACFLMHIFMPEIISVFTPGFTPEQLDTTSELARIMNPFLLLVSLSTIGSNVLQVGGKFFLVSALPCLLNIFMIVSQFYPFNTLEYNMSYAVLFAGIMQLAVILVALYDNGHKVTFTLELKKSEIKEFFFNVLPVIFGNCIMQVNILVNTAFASSLDGAVSYIYYADRISQLPQSLIGTAIGTVLLPTMSNHIRNNDPQMAAKAQQHALEIGMFFCIPATAAILTIPESIIFGLFGHGTFDNMAGLNTAAVLKILGYSLPAFVISRISLAVLYANNDRKSPVIAAIASLATNFLLNFILVDDYKYMGTAIAVTTATWVNAIVLGVISHAKKKSLMKKSGGHSLQKLDVKALGKTFTHICISSSIMIIVLGLIDVLTFNFVTGNASFTARLTILIIFTCFGSASYLYTMKKLTKKSIRQMFSFT